jgi:peptide/nickel transport system substrate-binding protein
MKRSGSRRPLVATALAASLVFAACGGDDDDGGDAGTEEDGGDTAAEDTAAEDTGGDTGGEDTAAEDTGGEDTGGDTAAEDTAAEDTGGEDTGGEDTGGDTATEDTGGEEAMAPVRGGTLTYLLEAETDTWDIPGANCAVSCITVMRQVAEPLAAVTDAGEVEPFLLESLEPNADFTEFTLVMRDGVTFHDGTPADGAAVQRNLQEMAQGILQGQVLADLDGGPDGVELVDPMTVKVTFTKPFATFPYNIADRTGYLMAPAFWDDPDRAGALPIGTGPFMMTEWTRDEQTVLEANPDYWRMGADGEPLPYLDGIVFRPNPDSSARRATLEAGDADANHDTEATNRDFWEGEWIDNGNHLAPQPPDRETTYLLLNNSKPPFDDVELRRALALCTDRSEYVAFRAPGNDIANGPFAEGALGYLEDTGFPDFDPAAGSAILDEIGRPDQILYGTTNDPLNLLTAELFADMWSTNCGLTVNIDQFDQSQLITKAITGDFEAFLWRNHGQVNPGLEYVWWHSRHAEGLALNFGRIVDPDLDALLDETWATDDLDELDRLGQEINRIFGEQVYNIWLTSTEWRIPYAAPVHAVGTLTLPSGTVVETSVAGRTWLHEAWKEG